MDSASFYQVRQIDLSGNIPRPNVCGMVGRFLFFLLGTFMGLALAASGALESNDIVGQTRLATEQAGGPVYVVPLKGPVSKAQFFFLRRALKEASRDEASAVILDMDTPGGELGAATKMVDALDKAGLPTITWVDPNAGSAGALIALATKQIYMSPYSAIGAAAPVMGGGQDLQETMKKKVVSYYSAYFRSVAQKNGHNPEVAEAFINDEKELEVDGEVICEKGALLTLSAQEATRIVGGSPLLAVGIADSPKQVAEKAGLVGELVTLEPTGFERLAYIITLLAPLFLVGGIAGTYIEMKTPGFGVPGFIAAFCFLVFFAGHFLAGLAGYEVLAIFVLGLVLIAVDLIFFPGTVVLGLVGTALSMGALVWTMVDRYPRQGLLPSPEMLLVPLLNLAIAFVIAIIVLALLARVLPETPLYNRLILGSTIAPGPSLGPSTSEADEETKLGPGAEGIAITPLHPSGTAEFGDRITDVVTQGDYIDRGASVRIVAVEGSRVVVESFQ